MNDKQPLPINRFRNHAKAVELGNRVWEQGLQSGLIGLSARKGEDGKMVTDEGHQFVNFSSCDYLGLHMHPKVVEGAIAMTRQEGFMQISTATLRIGAIPFKALEHKLSELVDARVMVALSCSALSAGVMPVLACGVLTDGQRPVMVFDRHSHFSMAVTMPMCGDETEVLSCKNNDLNFLEDVCRKNPRVVYVSDGTFSMGGHSLIQDLLQLQDRYGLELYLDDSHSFSLHGENGEGFIRTHIPEVTDRTMIVASMGKAFGSGGGVLMLGPNEARLKLLKRFAGGWSQNLSIPVLGASLASAEIHASDELNQLQDKLRERLEQFDSLIETASKGDISPIRLVPVGDEDTAVAMSKRLFERGFYSSAVFFPIVARGKAGLRVMMRANHSPEDITNLCRVIAEIRREFGVMP